MNRIPAFLGCVAAAVLAGSVRPAAAGAAPVPRLTSVLARHAAAVGGQDRVRSLRALTVRGVCQSRDGTLSGLTWYYQVPARSREEIRTANIFTAIQTREGADAWSCGPTGEVESGAPDFDNLVIRQVLDQYRYLDPRNRDLTVSLSADTADSAQYANLRIEALGAQPVVLSLDTTTWLVRKRTWRSGGVVEEEYLSDYRDAGGFKLPFYILDRRDGRPVQETQLLRAAASDSLPSALWRRPDRPVRDWTIADGSRSVRIPIVVRDGRVHLPVRVNAGRSLDFVLDTGSANTLLSEQAARLLRLPLDSTGVAGADTGDQVFPSVADSIAVGGAVVRAPARLPVGVLRGKIGGGALGTDFLSRFVVTVDYATKTLTLEDPIQWVPPAETRPEALNFNFGVPLATGTLDDCCPGNFLVSTAGGDAIHLRWEFIRHYDYLEKLRGADSSEAETDEHSDTGPAGAPGVAKSFIFCGQRTVSPGITYATSGAGEASTGGWIAGTVGSRLLSNYRVVLDYPRQRMYLEPSGSAAPPVEAGGKP